MSIEMVALLVMLVTAGVFASLGFLHASKHAINLEEFMVSRNRFGSWMAFATIASSAMGVWILFSLPEVGSTSGIAGILGYCLGSAAPIALFIRIGPRIRHLMPNGHSLNEFVLHRFGNAMYLLTLAIIVFYMFIYLTAELTGIAKAVQILADVPLGWTALVVITATFIYTAYGGLGSTIFTDAIQFVVIVPLLVVSLVAGFVLLGGVDAALAPVQLNAPELLSLNNLPGIKFGATLILAVLVAELFNQSNWQRVYACRNDKTVQRAFLASALVILPMLFIAGWLGILARHFGFNDDRAFFSLIQQLALPLGFTIVVLVLALALVMSTLSSLLNGVASVFTLDLIRLFPQMRSSGLLRTSRMITVIIGLIAVAIASQGYNVLYLFLLADLVCAGAFVPIVVGLYSRRLTGTVALWSAILGILSGAIFFPKPDFSPLFSIPFGGDLLVSFIAPIVVSTGVILLGYGIGKKSEHSPLFDFNQLHSKTQTYSDGSSAEAAKVME